MLKKFVIMLLIVLVSGSMGAARQIEGVDMPETVTIDGITVGLNGTGVRKAMFFKFYVGGLYLREAATDAGRVIDADEPMALRLHMIDDVGQSTMKNACFNGFRNATNDNIEPIRDRMDRFLECFSEPIKEGDIFEFKYLPGKGTGIYKSGRLNSTISGLDFKKAMFGIWLSDTPADDKLKQGMLAGDLRVDMAQFAGQEPEAGPGEAGSAALQAVAKAPEPSGQEQKTDKPAEVQVREPDAAAEVSAAEPAEKSEPVPTSAPAPASAPPAAESAAAAAKPKVRPESAASPESVIKPKVRAEPAKPRPAPEVSRDQVVSEDIYFASDDASLDQAALHRLSAKAAWLKENPRASVVIEVFCDPLGSEKYNLWLAGKRARSVVNYLKKAGIDESRLQTAVYGEQKIAHRQKKDWHKNRRAHFRIR